MNVTLLGDASPLHAQIPLRVLQDRVQEVPKAHRVLKVLRGPVALVVHRALKVQEVPADPRGRGVLKVREVPRVHRHQMLHRMALHRSIRLVQKQPVSRFLERVQMSATPFLVVA